MSKKRALLLVVLVLSSIGCVSVKRPLFDVKLTVLARPQIAGPCLASLIGPPSVDCVNWEKNVKAAPSYESARRYIFTGSGDAFLHVLDGDYGYRIADIPCEGRAITELIYSADRTILYVGTDKGVVHAIDAFSFKDVFIFTADSKISDNLTRVNDNLVFTSVLGTVYCLDGKTGDLKWQIEEPLNEQRLRVSSNANIVLHEDVIKGQLHRSLLVPHADGFISVIDEASGEVKRKIHLGAVNKGNFPDIIARMVLLKNRLWVASDDLGLFAIDLGSYQIRERIDIKGIVELLSDGSRLFLATRQALYSLTDEGEILWINQLDSSTTKSIRLASPFTAKESHNRVFFGDPSRILIHDKYDVLIIATSLGSIGVFDRTTGQQRRILGNMVGFGPKLSWAGPNSFLASSKRGLLMKLIYRRELYVT